MQMLFIFHNICIPCCNHMCCNKLMDTAAWQAFYAALSVVDKIKIDFYTELLWLTASYTVNTGQINQSLDTITVLWGTYMCKVAFFFNSFSSGFNFYNVGSDITIIILISFQSPWACARFLRHRRILLISIMRWKLHSTRGCWTLLASCRPPLLLWWRRWAKMSKDRLPKPTLRTCRPSLSSKLSSRLPREWPPYVVSLSNVKKCIANLL